MEKDKKKTLTISTNLTKKIDKETLTSAGKKSYSIEKKKPFRPKPFNRSNPGNPSLGQDIRKKTLLESLLSNKLQKNLSKKIRTTK